MLRLYTKAGELPYTLAEFPDGQPHFELLARDEWNECTVEADICHPQDLFRLDLVAEVLRHNGIVPNLDIRYLMGARMDRRISKFQPNTLGVVAHSINGMGFHKIRVLDVHSPYGEQALNAVNVLPFDIVRQILNTFGSELRIIVPDKGAIARVETLCRGFARKFNVPLVPCSKERDPNTGHLSNFIIEYPDMIKGYPCLIVDDICDGGGTFVGLAAELRKVGAVDVSLFVTHGIFSKGPTLAGIDCIYTTDSYPHGHLSKEGLVVYPILMKDL